jgi:hypothetical protein
VKKSAFAAYGGIIHHVPASFIPQGCQRYKPSPNLTGPSRVLPSRFNAKSIIYVKSNLGFDPTITECFSCQKAGGQGFPKYPLKPEQ